MISQAMRLKLTLMLIPLAILQAAPVTLTNTAGDSIMAKIQSANPEQVTVKRVSDGREFSIAMPTLDEPSQNIVRAWIKSEAEGQYFPATRPFYELEGEMIVPLRVAGDELTFLDTSNNEQTATTVHAPGLQRLAQANSHAQGSLEPGGFTTPQYLSDIQCSHPAQMFAFPDRLAYIDDPSRPASPAPRWILELDSTKLHEHQLWRMTYDIFLADISDVPSYDPQKPASELFWSSMVARGSMDEINRHGGNPKASNQGPLKPVPGEWIHQIMHIRVLPFSDRNLLTFYPEGFYGSFVIKNIALHPVIPKSEMALYTMADLQAGNIFHSSTPFLKQEHGDEVSFRSDAGPLHLTLPAFLDYGYRVSGEIHHDGGEITFPEEEQMLNLTKRINKKAGYTETSFSFAVSKRAPFYEDFFTIQGQTGEDVTIKLFQLTAELLPSAGELNPFHQ